MRGAQLAATVGGGLRGVDLAALVVEQGDDGGGDRIAVAADHPEPHGLRAARDGGRHDREGAREGGGQQDDDVVVVRGRADDAGHGSRVRVAVRHGRPVRVRGQLRRHLEHRLRHGGLGGDGPDDRDPHERGQVGVAERAGDGGGFGLISRRDGFRRALGDRLLRVGRLGADGRAAPARGRPRAPWRRQVRSRAMRPGEAGSGPSTGACGSGLGQHRLGPSTGAAECGRSTVGSSSGDCAESATGRLGLVPGAAGAARDTITTDGDAGVGAPRPGRRRRDLGPTRAPVDRGGDDRERRGLPRAARLGTGHPRGAAPGGVADLETVHRGGRLPGRRCSGRRLGRRGVGDGRHGHPVLPRNLGNEEFLAGQCVGRASAGSSTGAARRSEQVGHRARALGAGLGVGLGLGRRRPGAAHEQDADVRRRGEQDDDQPDQDHGGHKAHSLHDPEDSNTRDPRRHPTGGGRRDAGERIGPPWPAAVTVAPGRA